MSDAILQQTLDDQTLCALTDLHDQEMLSAWIVALGGDRPVSAWR
jgi:hypothetical protein